MYIINVIASVYMIRSDNWYDKIRARNCMIHEQDGIMGVSMIVI